MVEIAPTVMSNVRRLWHMLRTHFNWRYTNASNLSQLGLNTAALNMSKQSPLLLTAGFISRPLLARKTA